MKTKQAAMLLSMMPPVRVFLIKAYRLTKSFLLAIRLSWLNRTMYRPFAKPEISVTTWLVIESDWPC